MKYNGVMAGKAEKEARRKKQETDRDYREYLLNGRENLLCLLSSFALSVLVSWLFYQSFYAMAVMLPLYFLTRRVFREYLKKRRKREMLLQFGEMLQMLSAALKAGYSMENAFIQGWQEYTSLYGQKDAIAEEFHLIVCQMNLNIPLEKLVEDLARRSGLEEMQSFSQVFSFAKRGGGDLMKIFQDTVEKIRQKAEVEREIATVVAAKKAEQRIMDLVPFGILFYVGASSPEFLSPLYGNLPGALLMTVCLLGYVGAFLLAERILDIQI